MTSAFAGAEASAVRQSVASQRRHDLHHSRIAATEPGSWAQRLKVLDYVRAVLQAGADADALVVYLDDVNGRLR